MERVTFIVCLQGHIKEFIRICLRYNLLMLCYLKHNEIDIQNYNMQMDYNMLFQEHRTSVIYSSFALQGHTIRIHYITIYKKTLLALRFNNLKAQKKYFKMHK